MKKIAIIILLTISLSNVYGVESFIGPTYSTNVTGFWDVKKDTQDSIDYRFAPIVTTGFGLRWETRFTERIDANLEAQYFKSGAAIDYGQMTSYKPRYVVEYAGVVPGLKFAFTPQSLYSFSLRLALPVNIMTKAYNETATLARNVTDDVRRFELGALVSIGLQRRMRATDILQLEAYFQLGLTNVFQGMIADNGLNTKNYATGLKASYLLSWESF